MDVTLVLVLGFAAGVAAARYWPALGSAIPPFGTTPDVSPTTVVASAETPKPVPSRGETLHRLTATLDTAYQSTAHANEIKGLPEFDEVVKHLTDPATPLAEVVDYAVGTSVPMAGAALTALAKRPDGAEPAARIAGRTDTMPVWHLQYTLEYLAGLPQPLAGGAPLIGHQHWWDDSAPLAHLFADYFTTLTERGLAADPGDDLASLPTDHQQRVKVFLDRVRHPMAAAITEQLAGLPPEGTAAATPSTLASIGRFWSDLPLIDRPIDVPGWKPALDDAAKSLDQTPVRSLLVSGETLVGKTSFLRLLAQRLEPMGWRVFEASGADLQAGQQYIGQLEARIRQVLDELTVSKKLIWYVPDLLALALSGTHQAQSASILDQIMPSIAAGRLIVWGEGTPTSTARLLQLRPAVRRSFEVVRIDALDDAETQALARQVARQLATSLKLQIDDGFTDAAIEAAHHYLSASAMPGSALALMKIAGLRARKAKDARLIERDILDALAQLTGLPQSILDGSERLDLAETTAFFAKRVIGQPEAVDSVVERIAMLKSGLNDPGKPFGVFLFAGPTGTGKTELTKAIAEFLFGSTERMIRLDMSEYQAPDSIAKIIGGASLGAEADTLISRIRKQPFSLILLDEFEKSHPNVWDLFLQVFDEGRLTDLNGQTADFRHCLIILTTNLGATSHQSTGLGFAPRQNAYTSEQVLRSIGQTFRPEFQNRLDKIIVFRPLTREHMRGILKKELGRLFERRGLKDRDWAVEWEASALEFLLEKGFSPDMGARPLKRAIDQYVVAPLAGAIVERRAPEGEQFVFVRSDGTALQAEFVDPDGDGDPIALDAHPAPAVSSGSPVSLAQIMLGPEVTPGEIAFLNERAAALAERVEAASWSHDKALLSDAMNQADFWTRGDRFDILSRYELMDRISVAAGTVQALIGRLEHRRVRPGPATRDLLARLAQQIWLVGEGFRDFDEAAPLEVALIVEPALLGDTGDRSAPDKWRHDILEMYRRWCRRRGMQVADLDIDQAAASPALLVSGFGAHRILARETGLHVLERPDNSEGPSRLTVRVLLVPSPPGDISRAQRRQTIVRALSGAQRTSTVLRRYRREPSPLVRNADGSWRTGKLDAVLAGDFDVMTGGADDRAPHA